MVMMSIFMAGWVPVTPLEVEQSLGGRDHDVARRNVDGRHDRAHERHQRLPAVGPSQDQHVGTGAVIDPYDLADLFTVGAADAYGEADQLEVVKLVGVVGRLNVVG